MGQYSSDVLSRASEPECMVLVDEMSHLGPTWSGAQQLRPNHFFWPRHRCRLSRWWCAGHFPEQKGTGKVKELQLSFGSSSRRQIADGERELRQSRSQRSTRQ